MPHCAAFSGETCVACKPAFQGETCDTCSQGYVGEECSSCDDEYKREGEACNQINNPKCLAYSKENCINCITGFDGPTCSTCAAGYEGEDCSTCSSGYYKKYTTCEAIPSICSSLGANGETCTLKNDGTTLKRVTFSGKDWYITEPLVGYSWSTKDECQWKNYQKGGRNMCSDKGMRVMSYAEMNAFMRSLSNSERVKYMSVKGLDGNGTEVTGMYWTNDEYGEVCHGKSYNTGTLNAGRAGHWDQLAVICVQ